MSHVILNAEAALWSVLVNTVLFTSSVYHWGLTNVCVEHPRCVKYIFLPYETELRNSFCSPSFHCLLAKSRLPLLNSLHLLNTFIGLKMGYLYNWLPDNKEMAANRCSQCYKFKSLSLTKQEQREHSPAQWVAPLKSTWFDIFNIHIEKPSVLKCSEVQKFFFLFFSCCIWWLSVYSAWVAIHLAYKAKADKTYITWTTADVSSITLS